jgi:putative hydrolase of the HAD superfamily
MKALKAVFFDLDDTLCDDAGAWVSSAQAAARIAEKRLKIDPRPLADAFLRRSEDYWMSLEPVTETRPLLEIRASQWAGALLDVIGSSDHDLSIDLGRDYGERRSNDIRLFPDAQETITELKALGLKLALLTNGVQLTHIQKIEYLGLYKQFDHVLIADAIGSFKPDQHIFREALRLCDCLADEAIMVGDHLKNDIGGAQSVGIHGYWFNPNGLERSPGDPNPKSQIKALSELIALIEPSVA